SLKSGGSVTRQGVHELLALTDETVRLVKEALPEARVLAHGLTSTFHRMSVTATFSVAHPVGKESEYVVVNLDVEPVKSGAAHYQPPESHTGPEVAEMSITTGIMGADLVDPLMWPLPGSPGSEESDHAIEMFARAAQDVLRDAVPTILDILRKEMRDADRR
ncbi:MAG: hypothetical protein ABI635_11280, partial [Actinomycetota bacterium]